MNLACINYEIGVSKHSKAVLRLDKLINFTDSILCIVFNDVPNDSRGRIRTV
jgi:hypothetical protein